MTAAQINSWMDSLEAVEELSRAGVISLARERAAVRQALKAPKYHPAIKVSGSAMMSSDVLLDSAGQVWVRRSDGWIVVGRSGVIATVQVPPDR